MSNFLNAFESASTIGTTENGAMTFTSTLNHNLDFFALASAKRANPSEAVSLFSEAYQENPVTALLNLFYLRDVRGGQGERAIFRFCLERVDTQFITNEGFLKLIPEYGRWDDLIVMMYTFSQNVNVVSAIIKIIKNQIDLDTKSDHPSLLAKWIPLPNSVCNPVRKSIAHAIPKLLGLTERQWRKVIVPLRNKLKIVERLMTEGRYPDIDYAKIPSRCGYFHRAAFMRHDCERYTKYLEDLAAGRTKINSGTLYPYEIIYKLRELLGFGSSSYFSRQHLDPSSPEVVSLMEMWKALPEFFTKGNVLPVVDVSGSMFTPVSFGKAMAIDVSTSLGIYCAQHNTGMFKDHYVSFSESPMLIKLNPGKSLAENLQYILSKEVGYDTNFHKVFKVILKSMVRNNLPKEECPSIVLAISDMEFNSVGTGRTNFELIKKKYDEAGYDLPQLVFWNVMSRGRNVPVRKDENGVVLISGMSPSILRFISEGEINPEKFMMNVLLSERYHPVLEAISKIA